MGRDLLRLHPDPRRRFEGDRQVHCRSQVVVASVDFVVPRGTLSRRGRGAECLLASLLCGTVLPPKRFCAGPISGCASDHQIWPGKLFLVVQGRSPDRVTCGVENQDPKRPSLRLCKRSGSASSPMLAEPVDCDCESERAGRSVRLSRDGETLRAEGWEEQRD